MNFQLKYSPLIRKWWHLDTGEIHATICLFPSHFISWGSVYPANHMQNAHNLLLYIHLWGTLLLVINHYIIETRDTWIWEGWHGWQRKPVSCISSIRSPENHVKSNQNAYGYCWRWPHFSKECSSFSLLYWINCTTSVQKAFSKPKRLQWHQKSVHNW